MITNLKKLQEHPFLDMTSKLCKLLKTKYKEPEFFNQFETSYWNGMLKCWLSSELRLEIPRTNNGLEWYNLHIKLDFTENMLLLVNEFLVTFRKWASKESRRFSNIYVHIPMEHIVGKTNVKAIRCIHHVWREGQLANFNFLKKAEDWYVFKSEYGRDMHPNTDTNSLFFDHIAVDHVKSFNLLTKKYKSIHQIYLHEREWNCTCPYYM